MQPCNQISSASDPTSSAAIVQLNALSRAGLESQPRAGTGAQWSDRRLPRADRSREVGRPFPACVTVGLSSHTKKGQADFEAAMADASEVRQCHNITGATEYLLRIETADLAAYKHFHTEVLGVLPQVHAITTDVLMDSPKDERA